MHLLFAAILLILLVPSLLFFVWVLWNIGQELRRR